MFQDLSLEDWWRARTNYTRCTAVWSMLGYVFGVGDRHTANIMVQPRTGRVVHIDYEMMLDLGRYLKVAENVPFRMTANIEAPMGLLGPFGLFFLYCLEELQRLQRSNNRIANWVEALPLRSVGAELATTIQRMESRLRFSGPQQKIENNLFELINAARDPRMLETMFVGWNPLE